MHACELKEEFYQSFDATRIEEFIGKLAQTPESDRRQLPGFLGEGTHFQSFVLASQPMQLAVNVAKANFLNKGPMAIGRWRTAIRDLRTIETQALVPPIEIIQYQGLTAIVMPRGTPLTRKGAEARGLNDALIETSRALGKAGLILDDYPQMVEYQGRFFINDWSDLQCG